MDCWQPRLPIYVYDIFRFQQKVALRYMDGILT